MRLLFLDSPAFAKQDMIEAFEECDISCDLFFHDSYKERWDNDFDAAFDTAVSKHNYDFVFSFNYHPIISNCCMRHNLKYVAYVYDSPHVALYSYTLLNRCNYVFLFDKTTFLTFKNSGIQTVYYLPLAANVKRLSSAKCPDKLLASVSSEISFVGALYNEDHHFFERLNKLSPFTEGYLDAIMTAQQEVYGYQFLEELLTPDIIKDLQKSCPYSPLPDGTETDAYVYANYFLCREITSRERIALLKSASEKYELKLYTYHVSKELPNAKFMGTTDPYHTTPLIFQNSRINLNITLKSISSGIPLRCMEIMGSGGFLFTNFQQELIDFFEPEDDFAFFENEDDFINKISYFLSHEKHRQQITSNCLGKMKDFHSFYHRAQTILDIIF